MDQQISINFEQTDESRGKRGQGGSGKKEYCVRKEGMGNNGRGGYERQVEEASKAGKQSRNG
jgi:hypothetical protein